MMTPRRGEADLMRGGQAAARSKATRAFLHALAFAVGLEFCRIQRVTNGRNYDLHNVHCAGGSQRSGPVGWSLMPSSLSALSHEVFTAPYLSILLRSTRLSISFRLQERFGVLRFICWLLFVVSSSQTALRHPRSTPQCRSVSSLLPQFQRRLRQFSFPFGKRNDKRRLKMSYSILSPTLTSSEEIVAPLGEVDSVARRPAKLQGAC